MDRYEFISVLRTVLSDELPVQTVEEHVNYYNNYISEEIAHGKTESEVMEMLGDPRLIARTIIDTSGSAEAAGAGQRRQREVPPEGAGTNGGSVKFGGLNWNTWYGKLLVIVVIVLVLTLVFAIVGGIISLVAPILLPVLLILLVIRLLGGGRYR